MEEVLGEDDQGLDEDEDDEDDEEDEDEDDEDEDDDEDEEEEDDDDEQHPSRSASHCMAPSTLPYLGPERVRGTGLVFPSKFERANGHQRPLELFRGRVRIQNAVRCTYINDKSMLLLTDGACLNNGQANPQAGWAFFQGVNLQDQPCLVSGRLEKQGPWGDDGIQSSNRAELRAVIAALRLRHWPGEGFRTVVVATDSEYVVEGSTRWAKAWVKNNWRLKGKKGNGHGNVKNKDLWEMLLEQCERAHDNGQAIQFWKIPRDWNALVDEKAKSAAAAEEASDKWVDCCGLAF